MPPGLHLSPAGAVGRAPAQSVAW